MQVSLVVSVKQNSLSDNNMIPQYTYVYAAGTLETPDIATLLSVDACATCVLYCMVCQ